MTPAWLLLYNSQSRKSYSPCYNSAFPGHETLMEKVFSTVWVKSPPPHNLNTFSHSSKELFITLGALSAHCTCFLCAAFCRTLTRIFIPESIKKKKKGDMGFWKARWFFSFFYLWTFGKGEVLIRCKENTKNRKSFPKTVNIRLWYKCDTNRLTSSFHISLYWKNH